MIVVTFKDKQYDVSAWVDKHPGGARLIQSANGHDITEVFTSYHGHQEFERSGIRTLNTLLNPNAATIFESEYLQFHQKLLLNICNITSIDPWDMIMWLFLVIYLLDFHWLSSALSLIILGGYGHQYVHSSSHKASLLTLVGFISNHWRDEHVFRHHPYTNHPDKDPDTGNFLKINEIPLPSPLRFVLVSNVIVFRPFIQYLLPTYNQFATKLDWLAILYNIWDFWTSFPTKFVHWWLKRLIPAAWFLIIDYFNHYRHPQLQIAKNNIHEMKTVWVETQIATTQNFVFNEYLYSKWPFVHSLLTFGLDRQIEHHLFPKLKMEHLSLATDYFQNIPTGNNFRFANNPIQIHKFSLNSLKTIWKEFV